VHDLKGQFIGVEALLSGLLQRQQVIDAQIGARLSSSFHRH